MRQRMIDQIFWWVGFVACSLGGVIGLAILVWMAGNAWMDASKKWRSIFRAESDIIEYLQHRKEFERWKEEQEKLKDVSTAIRRDV